jgi:hypothetical protein
MRPYSGVVNERKFPITTTTVVVIVVVVVVVVVILSMYFLYFWSSCELHAFM